MAKKNKAAKPAAAGGNASEEAISTRGKKVIAAGVGTLVLGFGALCFTDAMGRNRASVLAPFLILGGYALVAAGIFVPDPAPTSSSSANPPQSPSAR